MGKICEMLCIQCWRGGKKLEFWYIVVISVRITLVKVLYFLIKFNIYLLCNPAIRILDVDEEKQKYISTKESKLYKKVQSYFICSGVKLEKIHMSIHWCIDKNNLWYTHIMKYYTVIKMSNYWHMQKHEWNSEFMLSTRSLVQITPFIWSPEQEK